MGKVGKLIFSAGFLLMFSSCGQGLADGTDGAVISVGERAVFPENVGESFERYRGDTLSVDIFKENIIARELFIAHAIDLGLDNDREVVRLSHERAREILQAQWLSHSLDQVQIRQEDVLHFWETLGTGISYTCFYDQDSILIDSVLTIVEDGESLSELAAEIGMDAMLRQTRGQITIVDVNYSNVMDHEHLISARAGDIIPPFPVRLGWRMLQIDSTWTYTPDPFESDSQRIASMLLSRVRESRKIFLEDSLKIFYNVQVDLDVLTLMAENADTDLMIFGTFEPEEGVLSAVTWDGGSRTLFSVTDNIMGLPGQFPRQIDDVQWLEDYARRLALFDIEMEEAIKLGLDTIPDVARRLDAKHWEAVLDKYHEVVISTRIISDSVAINEVYMEIREDNPIEESRIFHTLFLADAERIETAESMMLSGEDILASMDQFEIFPPILARDQGTITIPLTAAMIPENDREALFNLLSGEEAIVVLSDSTAIWLRLDSINEERIPALEDIRGRVVSETEQRLETKAIEALVDSLSGVYHLYVDEEYFEGFYTPANVDSTGLSTTEVL